MSKLWSPQALELQPGVSHEAFETFMLKDVMPLYEQYPGITSSLLKGERGERVGQYMLLLEIDSPTTRDYFFPESRVWPPEVQRMLAEHAHVWEQLATYVTAFPDPHATDYQVLKT